MSNRQKYLQRYINAIHTIGYAGLLDLPERTRDELINTTALRKKVYLLERAIKEANA